MAFLLFASAAFAQMGDGQRGGEIQKQLVPRELVPPSPALTPEQAMKSFKLAPGIKLELVAAEPLVQEPVAIAFGADGRMFVVEMRGYMPDLDGTGEDLPIGRVSVLRDLDGDGRYEDAHVFIEKLILPRAIAVVGDGVLVGAPPELAFYRDTDGDGKADSKEVIATDYGVQTDPKRPHLANPERAPNSLTRAFDNWIYSTAYTKKFKYVNGKWETGSTIFRGQWGLGEDDFGRFYYGSNSDCLRVDVIFSDYLQRNPHMPRLGGTNVNGAENQLVWPARVNPGVNRGYRPEMLRDNRTLKEFTAACGWWVYRGDALPGFYGNVFVAEPSANFVRRTVVRGEEGSVKGRNAYADEKQEFVASTDERFRPVSFSTGPDGALYIVDLYRGVLQHRVSLTSYLRQQSIDRGLVTPQHLGRIYRVVPADKPIARVGTIPKLSNSEWIEKLAHPNAWWRETAQRVLVERGDASTNAALRQFALKGPTPQGRMQALWTLEGLGGLNPGIVLSALGDDDPIVRVAAMRLSERFLEAKSRDAIVVILSGLAQHSSPEVQLQAVLTLGNARDPKVDRLLADVVRSTPHSTYLRDAFLSGVADRELAILEKLVADPKWPANDVEANKLLTGLARGVFGAREVSAIERLFAIAGESVRNGAGPRAVALLDGMVPTVGSSRRPLQLAAQPAGWSELEQNATAKSRLARLNDLVIWPGKPGVSAVAEVKKLTAEQQQRFEAGKTLFTTICATCHQITGRGLDGLAPPLLDSEWLLGSIERPVRIALNGVRGNITVLGKQHTGDMPAFGAVLDDQQLASVLTYVRREWGHTASPVEPEQVKAIRAAVAGHNDAWSPEELNQFK